MVFFVLFATLAEVLVFFIVVVNYMNIYGFIFLFLFSFMCAAHSDEHILYSYLYPCGSSVFDGVQECLVLYQKDAQTTELYRWNPITHDAHKELHAMHVPCGIRMLPSGAGYSFIEDGRVKIKYFIKRSTKAIDFMLPVYNVSMVNWISDDYAYCSAQEGERFGIYFFNCDGKVVRLLAHERADFLSPSLVGDQLYCIKRYPAEDGRTMRHAVLSCVIDASAGQVFEAKSILNMGVLAGQFLRMESDVKGFVVGYDQQQSVQGMIIRMHYYCIECINGVWHTRFLFTMLFPAYFFNAEDPNRLCESVMPLLPLHYRGKIYYSSLAHVDGSCMQIYCYDQALNKKSKCFISGGNRSRLSFGLYALSDSLFCGGALIPGVTGFVPAFDGIGGKLAMQLGVVVDK